MTEPKTLVQVVGQRWQSSMADQQAQLPFVYAQLVPVETPGIQTAVSTPHATPIVKPNQTQPPLLDNGGQAAKPISAKTQTQAVGKAAANDTLQTKANATTPTAVSKPTHSPKTETRSTSPTTPPSLAQTPSSAPIQNDAVLPVSIEVAASQPAGKASLADRPLPIVKAKQSTPPTAVSPATSSAKPIRKANGSPAAAAPARVQSSAVASPPTATLLTPAKDMRAAPFTEKGKTEPTLVGLKTQASIQSPVPPAKPVVKPRSAARKAPITFPSATPDPATANGRSLTTNLADGLLPVVRSERSLASPSTHTQTLSLPKTAVVTPSQLAPAPSAPASSSASGGSGIIQRQPDDEAPEATNAPAEAVDIDEIVAEVQRQFMRELAIEGERRGVTSWY